MKINRRDLVLYGAAIAAAVVGELFIVWGDLAGGKSRRVRHRQGHVHQIFNY